VPVHIVGSPTPGNRQSEVPPYPSRSTPLDTLTSDLLALVRRHDPAWTGSNDSDPGVTLLEIGAWLADRLYSSTGIGVSQAAWWTAARSDPYRNFNFRVKWDGAVIGNVTRISALRRTTKIIEHRDGSAPDLVQRIPGGVVWEPFTLERPLGADTSFEDWADQLRPQTAGVAWRKNVRIEILDHAGRLFLAYDVLGCWPACYRILPDLTESITLLPESWQRDRTVQPVAEAAQGRARRPRAKPRR
jgi:phage tail-like protein